MVNIKAGVSTKAPLRVSSSFTGFTSFYFIHKPAMHACRSVTLPGAAGRHGIEAASFAYARHFLFKHCTINQLMPQLKHSPCSSRRCNAHHDHYERLVKIPTTTYALPSHQKHNCYQPLQPHHHNHLNHSQHINGFSTDTTALPSPHYNRNNCHQPLGHSTSSEGAGGTNNNAS